MPSAAARRFHADQIPSFMSVFDLDPDVMTDRDTVTVVDPRLVDTAPKAPTLTSHQQPILGCLAHDPTHKHHDSTSTSMSESADSSPTTTLSTSDSSPLSDPSPSSSPDSPVNLIPLNNYPSTTFGSLNKPQMTINAPEAGSFLRPMTSPSPRRPRNMKGLSIQPPVAATTSTNSIMSEPSSPSFIKPKIPAMKRKPSMLSLQTDTSNLNKPALEVPPSPAMPPMLQKRSLKHSTSSPHMHLSIKSSTFGPRGGMTLPNMLERGESGLSNVLRPMKATLNTLNTNISYEPTIKEEATPIRSQLASRMDFEPYHEKINNEDQKTPGYPDGPIAIYDDNVFLYLEPTAEEAARFDIVFNVASEVRNPFEALEVEKKTQSPTSSDVSPIPETAVTTASFATAFEWQPSDDRSAETPTTPKANPFKVPEYIHMPWDHNTDIFPDLMRLCQTIDTRVKEGKKVLIHCQQGASRSASLIIAYGMYREPHLSVNDAYYAAQSKSQWISPNMKLMYCLQDFQKEVSKKRASPTSNYNSRAGHSPMKHRLTLSADAIETSLKEPRTAPLPREGMMSSQESPRGQTESRLRGNSTPGLQGVSPGPASAPMIFSWKEDVEQKTSEHLAAASVKKAELPERPKFELHPPAPIISFSQKLDLSQPAPAPALAPITSFSQKLDFGQPPPAPITSFAQKLDLSQPPPTPGFGPPAGFGFQSMDFPRFVTAPSRMPPPPPPPVPKFDAPVERQFTLASVFPENDAMMSPREETMTCNPLHGFSAVAGMRFVESPPTPTDGLFSPRATMFPRDPLIPFGRPGQIADPRSPPTKGETPITRSIDDIL